MDKKRLNNEIVLCRAAVKKAKVAVIRKILKKMKILKTCKVEGVKEKKLRKCERLFEKVQIMKRVKVDDVTKFALRNSDLGPFLKATKHNLKQNAMACLARHNAVMKKVNSIREQIPKWETELPLLLDSLGKKKLKKSTIKKESSKNTPTVGEPETKVVIKSEVNRTKVKVENTDIPKMEKPNHSVRVKREPKYDGDKSGNSPTEDLSSETVVKTEKIDDPFFIGKKVIAPKLVLESSSAGRNKDKMDKQEAKPLVKREKLDSPIHTKPFKVKKEQNKFKAELPKCTQEEENLHPSWAAKKVKLIQPFQGKKITFSND